METIKISNKGNMPKSTYTVYFAGELFNAKHLIGNAALAESIYSKSKGQFIPVLPQNLEVRETSSHAIRDTDIKALLASDLAIFNYDGVELDSGTVVEFMFAKFADIPSVIIRTDFRKSGDQDTDPWNLMSSFYPRTHVLTIDCVSLYRKGLKSKLPGDHAGSHGGLKSSRASQFMMGQIALDCVQSLKQVLKDKPVMPASDREAIYRWLAAAPNFRGGLDQHLQLTNDILRNKVRKHLL